jgi:hypothetical protein
MNDDDVILKFFVPPILALVFGAGAAALARALALPLPAGVLLSVFGIAGGWWLGKQLEDL